MSTYSFIDVSASLTGPTGSIDLGYGSANSEEGITVVMAEAKNTHDRRRRRGSDAQPSRR